MEKTIKIQFLYLEEKRDVARLCCKIARSLTERYGLYIIKYNLMYFVYKKQFLSRRHT